MTSAASTEPTRRERQRQATYDEIVDVARPLLRGGARCPCAPWPARWA